MTLFSNLNKTCLIGGAAFVEPKNQVIAPVRNPRSFFALEMVIQGEFFQFILVGLTSAKSFFVIELRADCRITFETYSVSQPATGQLEGTAVNLHCRDEPCIAYCQCIGNKTVDPGQKRHQIFPVENTRGYNISSSLVACISLIRCIPVGSEKNLTLLLGLSLAAFWKVITIPI